MTQRQSSGGTQFSIWRPCDRKQVQRLRRHGVEEFHFYTLNRADVTYDVCQALGLRASHTEAQLA